MGKSYSTDLFMKNKTILETEWLQIYLKWSSMKVLLAATTSQTEEYTFANSEEYTFANSILSKANAMKDEMLMMNEI